MPVTLRTAAGSDASAMAAIRAQHSGNDDFWTDRISRYLSGEHSPQQALPARAAFVAVDDGILVGLVAGHRTRRLDCDGELQWIHIVQERRRQGIAYQLMARMGAWFVEQDALRVCVNVDSENITACKLYARCGAHWLNKHWMVWDDARDLSANALEKAAPRSD